MNSLDETNLNISKPKLKGAISYLAEETNKEKDVVSLMKKIPTVLTEINKATEKQKNSIEQPEKQESPVVTADEIRNAVNEGLYRELVTRKDEIER